MRAALTGEDGLEELGVGVQPAELTVGGPGSIRGPSSAAGEACTPRTRVPSSSVRRRSPGRLVSNSIRPAWPRTPRVQPIPAATRPYQAGGPGVWFGGASPSAL